tara:strand:- start:90 stop:506 length:417 start_codon:yes stop_codon:yes gene_type:complete
MNTFFIQICDDINEDEPILFYDSPYELLREADDGCSSFVYEGEDTKEDILKWDLNEELFGITPVIDWIEKRDDTLSKKVFYEGKELVRKCEILNIIAEMGVSDIYEYAEEEDAKRLCELGWAEKEEFACFNDEWKNHM